MKTCFIFFIRLYQALTWWIPHVCRFSPSCSNYGLQALQHHGVIRGGAMTILRVLRCHPFHPGGLDPVPGFGEDGTNIPHRGQGTPAHSSTPTPERHPIFQGETVPSPRVSPNQPVNLATGPHKTGD